MTKPVLAGVVIGALLIGIVLATVVTIYAQDHSRQSTDLRHPCFPVLVYKHFRGSRIHIVFRTLPLNERT